MASGRMLQRKISKNESLPIVIQRIDEQLGWGHGAYAALLFTWCIAHQDVEGRIEGDPRVVRANVFTMIEWVTSAHVEHYLVELAKQALLVWYEAAGRKWIWFPGFACSQIGLRRDREAASLIPPPEEGRVLAGTLPAQRRSAAGVTPDQCRSDAGGIPTEQTDAGSAPSDLAEMMTSVAVPPLPESISGSSSLGNAAVAAQSAQKPPAAENQANDAASRNAASKSASALEFGNQEDDVASRSAANKPTSKSNSGGAPERFRTYSGVTDPLKLEVRSKKQEPEETPGTSASPPSGPISGCLSLGNAAVAAHAQKPPAAENQPNDVASRNAASKSGSKTEIASKHPEQPEPVVNAGAAQQSLALKPLSAPKASKTGPPRADVLAVLEFFNARWVETRKPADGKAPTCTKADFAQLTAVIAKVGVDEARHLLERYLDDPDPFLGKHGHALRLLPSRVDGYRATSAAAGAPATVRAGPRSLARSSSVTEETRALRKGGLW